jgi:Ca-activated chloride channel family protein
MSGTRRLSLVLVALVGLVLPVAGGRLRAAAAGDPVVTIERPDAFTPVSGEVEVEAVVRAAEPVARVTFLVDGVQWGEETEPPYRLTVDVGGDNVEHLFQVVAYAASGATGVAEVRTPKYRSDEEVAVTLQQLYATVTCGGERVRDLGRSDFELREGGRRQEIVTFGSGEIPYTAIVLVDASESMSGAKIENARRGARAFFGGMRELDEGKLIVFSDRTRASTPFSNLRELLTAGLGRIRAAGGSAVNDHLYLALRQLEPRHGRRLVVLLSDGQDAHSVLDATVLLDTVRRSQALIYWLRLTTPNASAHDGSTFMSIWRSPETNRAEVARLVEAVVDSGGRIEPVVAPTEIEPAFRGILDELADQYALGFYPSDRRGDGRWRKVEISIRRAGCKVRSRAGFLDF